MIFIGIITALSVLFMFYGSLRTIYLAMICISIFIFMALKNKEHSHSILSIDEISRENRMAKVSSEIKIILSIVMIIVCVLSKNYLVGFSILILTSAILILGGGIKTSTYIRFLSIPMAFIFIGGMAIAINYSKDPMNIASIKFFSGYIGMELKSQMQARLVVSKSFGAVSSLYIMSLTTPMSEIIRALKKMHIPSVIIDLMYLIYRCIFIIYEMQRTMKVAAQSRMGYLGYKRSLKTTAKIYSNLLMRSYISSSRMFDAMMSRCYYGEINFLQNKKSK